MGRQKFIKKYDEKNIPIVPGQAGGGSFQSIKKT